MTDTLKKLNSELESALINFNGYHSEMDKQRSFYLNSAFYPSKSGAAPVNADLSNNLLRVYADMNIDHSSAFPNIKVPTTGATPEERQAASIREKIILATWRKSGGRMLQRKWSFDGTVFSAGVAVTKYDIQNRCAIIERYDPRYCFWQVSNGNNKEVTAFWAVYPITKDDAKAKYGIDKMSADTVPKLGLANSYLNQVDGKDWFMLALRLDATTRQAWIGDQWVEEPHAHQMGGIPVDVAIPFDIADPKGHGGFYLDPLVPLQANLNHTIQRRDRIVERYANPVMYAQGLIATQMNDLKEALKNGGFVGLKAGNELGILQLQEVKVLTEHEQATRDDMQRASGFSAAAMGELAGANTSGDALGMYFNRTQRFIENQHIAWIQFYESINAKILRATEAFAKTGEVLTLSGYSPKGTITATEQEDGSSRLGYQGGGFNVQYTKEMIGGNYTSVVAMNSVTPKNEIEEKRLVMDMMNTKVISRTSGYEAMGLESPEDELALLKQEQSEPELNPQGMQQLVAAASQANEMQQPQTPQPLASATPDVRPV